ncbi:MAG: hypothetical protein M0024_10190 [Nitrospiraceae bacterium]|nr:hypothetical protein [Nitrospiraceae bacterium]
MSNWKRLEKKAAATLGGTRNSRGMDFSLSIGDVEHPRLSIECKYRNKISGFLKDGIKQAERYYPEKIPVLVLKEKHMRGELAILKLSDFQKLFGAIGE